MVGQDSFAGRPYLQKKLESSNDLERYMYEELRTRVDEFGDSGSFVDRTKRSDWVIIAVTQVILFILWIWGIA